MDLTPSDNQLLVQAWCEDNVDGWEMVPTTSDGDGGDGDASDQVWICNGSPQVCGKMTELVHEDDIWKEVEIPVCMSGNIPDCVLATEETAPQKCEDLCALKNGSYLMEAEDNDYKKWTSFVCSDFHKIAPALAENPKTMCSGGGPMWQHQGVGMLAIQGPMAPASQSSAVLPAVVAIAAPPCRIDAEVCELWLNGLRIGPVQLLQPVLASYHRRTGEVTFLPGDVFLQIEPDPASLVHVVDTASGLWDGQKLTLQWHWTDRAGTLSALRVVVSR